MKENLHQYLLEVAKAGYANKEAEREWVKNPDGSTTINHKNGAWSMHDNFFGGEPYGGREVIFHDGKPYWIMVYYGEVSKDIEKPAGIYSFLQDALALPDPEMPIRGPRQLEANGMKYEFEARGDIEKFEGVEKILKDGNEVYNASFIGGLVDQRGE
jgi:hypothetical protein